MDKYKKTIKGLECCLPMTTKDGFGDCYNCPYNRIATREDGITICCHRLMTDALILLKAQEPATIEPKRIELADETKAWLDKMDAVDALGNIADICVDWDGYRTADGLGGLINEIWAYARYCADRLLETQKPHVMTLEEVKTKISDGEIAFLVEYNDIVNPIWLLIARYLNTLDEFVVIDRLGNMHNYGANGYNVDWRCWTSRPTDEQREAEPWE